MLRGSQTSKKAQQGACAPTAAPAGGRGGSWHRQSKTSAASHLFAVRVGEPGLRLAQGGEGWSLAGERLRCCWFLSRAWPKGRFWWVGGTVLPVPLVTDCAAGRAARHRLEPPQPREGDGAGQLLKSQKLETGILRESCKIDPGTLKKQQFGTAV